MAYSSCPECGSRSSEGKVWACLDCKHKGHSEGTFNGTGCWSGSGGCPICGSSNYKFLDYIG